MLDRVDIRPAATLPELGPPAGRTFMKVDCEGCELELLRPAESDLLRSATVLVELHEFRHSGTTEDVLARFAATHTAELIDMQPRSAADYPEVASVRDARVVELILSEHRLGHIRWALLTPSA